MTTAPKKLRDTRSENFPAVVKLFGFTLLISCFWFSNSLPNAEASQIKRVQRGTAVFDTDDVTKSVTLPYSVDLTKTIVLVTANTQTTSADQNAFFTAEFEDNTTININRAAGTAYASAVWRVVEFEDGVVVQRGVSSMQATGATNKIKDIAIATTGTSTSLPIIQVRAAFTGGTQTDELHLLPSFTSSTNMRLERKDASGTKAISIVWQVIDFLSDVTIQTGTDIIPADNTADDNYVDVTVSAAANPMLFTYYAGGTAINGLDDAESTMGEYMSAGPNLRFHRYNNANSAGQQIYLRYYLLDFTDGASTSQTGYTDWAAASSNTLTIAAASTRTIETQTNSGVQNTTPVRIKTTASHGFATGDVITIAGTAGTALNINTTSGTGIQNTTPIKIRTTTNHTFTTGDTVTIASPTMPSIAISSWTNSTPIRMTTATHNMNTGSYITVSGTTATTRTIATLANGGIVASGGLVKIKTTTSHVYSTGARVAITSAGIAAVNAAAATPWTITVIDADEFYLQGSESIYDSIPVSGGGGGSVNAALNGNYQVTRVSATQLDLNSTFASGTVSTQGAIVARLAGSWVMTSTAVNEFTLDGTVASGAGNSGTVASNAASLNTTWTITNVDADEFTLDGSTKAGLGGGGTVAGANISGINKRNSGQTVRVTTTGVHGLATGSIVDINGATETYINGTWPVTVVDTTSFLLAGSDSVYLTANSGGGTVQKPQNSSALTAIVPSRTIDMISTQAKSVLASATNRGGDDLAIAGWLNTDPANSETTTTLFSTIRGVTSTALASRTQFLVAELSPVTLKTFNGGEYAAVGSTVTVNWKSAAGVAAHDWKLQISTDAPHATWTDLTGGTYGTCGPSGTADCTGTDLSTNTVDWKVPDLIGSTVKLRLVDTTDSVTIARRSDQSNADFTIHGTFTITSPIGGEGWSIGSPSNITWTKTGTLDYSTVTLKLSTNSGSSFPTTITSLLVPSSLSYSWSPVAANDGIQNRVRVELASDPTHVYSESPADFAVRGSITVTSPNGAEEWPTLSDQDITWTRTGVFANVKIEYSENSGGAFPTVITASTPADPGAVDDAGTYTWSDIPIDSVSQFGRIKVTNVVDSNVSDMSDADFKVVASLSVTRPNTGLEVWHTGTVEPVTWEINGPLDTVRIDYSTDGGSNYSNNVVVGWTASTESYDWTIPDAIGDTVRVKVADESAPGTRYDESDADFKIRGNITISSPGGGEIWPVGSTQIIQWVKDGSLGNVDVLYSTNGGVAYPNTLATNQTGTVWTWDEIPDVISNTLRVRVRATNPTYAGDTYGSSTSNFAIKGSLTVTSPNGAEQWGANTSHNITWNKTGTIGSIKLEYSTDGGVDDYSNLIVGSTAVDNATANSGYYTWSLPSTVGTEFRVRASLLSDLTVNDASNANFSIRGSVTIVTPNGGQTWIVGDEQYIDWSIGGTIANLKLEYSTNSGSSYIPAGLITASTPAPALSYVWTIPDAIGALLRVRASDASDVSVNDESDADFTIKGSLTLTAPNGGESWVVGSSEDVEWTKTGTIASVKLEYSTDSGSTYPNVITASTPGALLAYAWTIPNAIGTTLKVRVSNVADALVKDESDFDFGIKGSITVTVPNGGEAWSVGDTEDITWTKTGTLSGNLKLEYSTDAGGSWPVGNLITNTQPASGSSYSWEVPDAPTVQGRVRITQLDDTSVTDSSDGSFSIKGQFILDDPNGGETWVVGENRDINWQRIGSIANARLDYSVNSGSTFPNQITASTPAANESYTWTIPDAIGALLRVKVTDANDSSVSDASDGDFSIKGSLTVTAPNGGQTWVVGASENITWTKTGTIANVKLEYSTNAFATEAETHEIVASTPGANLTYAWTIPDAIDNSIKVRITNLADASVTDVSDANFSVKGSLTMGSPNGTEAWVVGESRNIIWTMTGSIANVKLEYSTNSFLNETETVVITASTPAETDPPNGAGSGQYAWTVADAIGTNLKMRVTDVTNATVTDVSNAAFEIIGSVTLTAPNGNEVWAVASDHAITWTRTGTFNNVKLTYSTDSGSNYSNLISASTPADPAPVDNSGTFTWTIPDNITTQARVRVANAADEDDVRDESDANFKIRGGLAISTPNGGEKWTVAQVQNVSWTKFGTISSTVKLDYSTDGGSSYPNSIATGLHVVNASPYAWTIPSDTSATVKVRVMSEADSDTVDASDANFKIMPKFTVTDPNGGEVWSVASSQTLGWTTDGSSPNVKITYSTDGGVNYSNSITASTSNTGSYSWTVPDAIGTAVRIKVEQADDADAFDTSNANFKIRGVLQVNHPNGGNQWNIGSSQNIQWTRTGSISNVKLEYSSNAFADELETTVIIASTPADPAPSDNIGIYAWTIPDTPGVTNRVRVSDASDATAFDTSNANFSIKGSLALNVPNGGETWIVATTENIEWTRTGSIANVKLEYSEDSGGTWPGGNVIIASTPADPAPADDDGVYSWTIPDAIGTALRVRVSDAADASVEDTSSADFEVKGSVDVTSPNGGETWLVGNTENITWTTEGSFLNVKLEYSTNAFLNEDNTTLISGSTPNDGTYAWPIPDSIGTNLKIRITDASDAEVEDVSNAAFTVKGSLTVTSPNGTEVWKVGESRNVTWNRTGTFANVKIEYSTNGGSSYPNTISASTDATTGTYSWTVPDAIGTSLKVKVTNLADTSVNDESNANFEVKGTITLTAPNGSESWAVSSLQNVTWTKTGTYANVKLEYSTNAFASELETTEIATGIDAVTGTPYVWTIPDAIDSTVKVRVTNEADAAVTDISNTNFKITGALTLDAPNGGENWAVATSQTVSWTPVGSIANVKLEYSTNSGSTYPNVITASTAAGAGAYSWTIPDSIGSTRRVKVTDATDATVSDVSNNDFSIMGGFAVTAPNGGEVWTVGSAQSVTWSTNGTVANVKLEYSTNGFSDELQTVVVSASSANTGTYSWTVPNAIATTVKVRVSDVTNANAFDISNGNAKIRGALAVNTPNGGDAWLIGNTENIQWTRTGSIANVKLEYSSNAFVDELQTDVIIASTPADPAPSDNIGIYAWEIPDAPSITTKVRVTDASDATVLDTSNANFSIKGQLILSAPNGGEIWVVASNQNIQWTKFGSISNVKLEYSTDSGDTWPGGNLIVASTAADPPPSDDIGTYSWTIDDAIGTTIRVRVSDASDPSTLDVSNNDFKIRGAITMTSPNGGEAWIVGASNNVTWTSAGSYSNVKLEYSTNAFADELETVSITSSTPNDGSFSWTIPDAIDASVKVRGSDASDATVTDVSNAAFTIKGSLAMTSPNGTEVWKVGESRNLTWNRTGSIMNVKLEYSTNGGSSYPNVITASTDASTGTYAWTVPDAIGSQLRVKVSDVTDATVEDASDANFQVKGTIALTAPNGGNAWAVGSVQNITWTKTGTYATVKLEYSTNAFADELQTTEIATGIDAVTGTPYAWTIPDAIDSSVKVRVTNETDTSVTDSSDTNFKIVGSLTLDAPNGGESWAVGTTQIVSWTPVGSIADVKLEYSTNSGSTYPNVITAATASGAGAYNWNIPDSIGTTRRVKITDASDATVFDTSAGDFTIKAGFEVTDPDGGEVWTVGSAQSITWNTSGSVANVKLEYSTNAFSDELQTTVVAASTANTGTYSWTVSDAISNLVRVRVSDVNNSDAKDISNASFKVRGALAVNAPNGGEAWLIGNSETIRWTRTGSISAVKVEYSSNAFSDELQTEVIVASTPADPAPADNIGTYSWAIPDNPGITTKVRVTDASDATVLDTSNANFSIKGQLILSSPNGSEVWVVATNQNIQWTKYGSISNVKLEYSEDSGDTWPGGNLIVASTAADPPPSDDIGTYSWTIDDAIGTTVRVRVSDASDPSTLDVSNNDFKIRGSIAMTSPNGGEAWIVGANNNITWTSAGSYSNVKLEYSTNGFLDELETVSITSSTPNDGSFTWTIPDAIDTSVKVRGSDASDSTVNDMSNANFTIKGSLDLTSPDGGETWKVGESRAITWNRTGSITNVKLQYSVNGGSAYPNTIAASTDASTGTYAWTIPDAIGTQLRVKVSDVSDVTVEDASALNFAIKGTVTLTRPNGGEIWVVDDLENVTWTKTGTYATVKLEYSTNAFADELQTTTIATGVDSVTGTPYSWSVPDTIGSALRIRINNETDPTVVDTSNLSFSVVGSLLLTAPNGSENWGVGTSQTITWERVGSIANAKLEYSTNGGSTYPNVISASTGAAAEAFLWTIPDAIGSNRKVKISDASNANVSDVSDANFTIMGAFTVTEPDGGEVWTVASAQSIEWNTTGTVSNVKLEYSKNAFSDELETTVIVASTANTGTYSWTVADAISNLMKIRVSDVNNANAFDISNAIFKIRGAILVTDPNGGEPWEIGTDQNITWDRTGSIAAVKIEYSTNGFSDELQTAVIIASTDASLGTYEWTIPDTPGVVNKIRVTDASDATVLDTSNANFTIKGRLVLSIPSNSGIVWTVAGVNNITWTKFGAISNVALYYSNDSGSTWPGGNIIVASTAADPAPADDIGTYSWTIPDSISTTMRVRVQDAADSSTYDDSNNDFKIRGAITITSPNGGEAWIVGASQNITWTSQGSYSNAKLEYSTNAFANESNTFSITAATPNDGSFSWTIPDAIGSEVRVRGSDASDSTVNDMSNANFTVKGSLTLTSPNGNEIWKVGEARNITWNRTGSIANVKLERSVNGGSSYTSTITNSTDASTGTYSWTVPDAIGTQLRIKVSDVTDATVEDASDANFEIKGTVVLTAPNGGQVWIVNSLENITWSKTGTYSTVKLEYSTDGFSNSTTIATGVDSVNGTPYAWTVPDAISSTLKVRVTNESDAAVTDSSDLNFKIAGSFTLNAPNGGESWGVGTSRTITWTRVGSIANAKLELSTNGGSSYDEVISASTSASAEAFIWTIPDMIGTTRKVKISDVSDATVSDVSNAVFTIKGAFTVTSPNGGEVWTVSSGQLLTWSTVGSVSNVKLEYSTNAFADELQTGLIVANVANSGSYSWTVSDAISNLVRMRVSDVNNADAKDVSDASFKIRGALLVSAPNGGEPWEIGNTENITWSRTGSIGNVKIEYSTNGFSDELQTAVIIASTPADPAPSDNAGIYAWQIPDTPSTSTKVRISDASDATVLDTSNSNFIIKGRLVLSIPNGGEIWTVAGVNNITWTKFGAISNVQLQYSTDSGDTWPIGNLITASTAADPAPADDIGTYSWTIPDAIATTVRVRVQDAADSSTYDDSNADFKIKGDIDVTSPNGGEIWIVGTNQNVTWTSAGSFSNVKLEYSTDAFANENNTSSITPATPNDGSFTWTIPDAIGSSLRVRASDAADNTVVDTTNSNFTIKGSVAVTSPNGGEVWKVGESRAITWNRAGSFTNVKIDYSTNGGSTFPNAISASTAAGAGTYTWTIPDAIGSQVRVQVADASDSTVTDSSDLSFAIKGTVTLTNPNGSNQWPVDTAQNITWTKTGTYSTVLLEYSTNAFADELQTTVIASSVDAANGTPYSWTVPDAIGSTVRVRVTNESDATVTDKSDNNFKIVGSLELTAPNGGESWNVGTSQTVSWDRVGSIANVKLEYSSNGGSSYPNLIVSSTSAGAGAYSWTVPDSIGTNRRVKVTDVTDSTVSDTSDADFAIVATFNITQPNGGEVWTVDAVQNITWATTGSVSAVKLEYSTDGGSTYPYEIVASTPNNATYSWQIPNSISTLVKIRISDVNNANGFDISNAVFKIRGALTVDAPNGGEQWGIGTSENIRWTRTGSIANVKLEYSSNGFSDELVTAVIIASTPADPAPSDNIGIYSWTIPDNPGIVNKVRVTDVADATVLDLSNGVFSIKGSLTIQAPNGGESWIVGSPYNITWIKGGAIANVKLQYSTDSGVTWPDPSKVITSSTSAGFLSYTWTIPDDINNKGRIRILDTNDNSVNDTSNADFSIRGSLQLTSPDGTEIWTVGDAHAITWTKTGTIANVKLDYSTDGGSTYPGSITASTGAAAGTYNWVVPDSISTAVRVKITQTNDALVTDYSEADFEIRGSLTITSPNGGEVWRVSTSQPITWTKTGTIPTVKLDYSINGGSTYPFSITTGLDGTAGSYSWTIPNAITTNAKIKVTNEDDADVFDGSDSDFKIAGSILVSAPNGGEKWQVASTQEITWAITGSINSVKIEYANDASTYTNEIASSVNASSGTPYNWTIPDDPTIQARVKVTNTADTTVFDTSNSNFKIQGSINLTSPNGGETWNVGESKSITWTKAGSFANVKIDYSTDSGATYPNSIAASTPSDNLSYSWTIPDNISTEIRVRVQDVNDTEVVDTSAADLTIRGVLAITAPNGSEVWRVGQAQNITWTVTGTVAAAMLEYSTNGFSNETQTYEIVSTTPAANLTYAWNIPDSISNSVKVRITDTDGVSLGDMSNGNFSIKGLVTVTSPNGGESYGVNSAQNITWTRTGSFANVKLEYSTNAFSNEDNTNLITASTPADPAPTDNAGTYAWTVPDAIATTVKIRVTDSNDAATTDVSNNSFTIRGILTITAPNGGEKWIVGTTQLITWDRQGSISNVKLQYTTNGSIFTDISLSTPNTGTYAWEIPNSVTTTGKVRIYDVNNATVTDDSNANFKIQAGFTLSSPNGGEAWIVGASQTITWSTSGTVPFIRLDYSTDSGSTYAHEITTSTANAGSYAWTIPDSPSGTVKVKVSDTNDAEAYDESNADLRIRASLNLIAPNGSEQWRVGQSRNITWTNIGTLANVKLVYSRDNFQADNQVITAATPNLNTYAWTVPDSISNTVRVRISDPNDIGAYDSSANDFRITGDFTVTSPNGTEKWNVDSDHDITWTQTGTVANAKIEYSTNAGGSWSPIVGLTPNNGLYTWTIPDTITAQGRVQISDPNDATAYDISDANFKIRSGYILTAPNGTQVWTVGDTEVISWTYTGTVANSRLWYSTDSGANFPNVIISSTANSSNAGTYNWTIPDAVSTAVRVRAGSSTDTDAYDDSNADFKIRAKFLVSAPNGAEQWKIGQSSNIQWVTTGTVANVKLYYSTNSGTSFPNVIVASTANAASGVTASYSWTLPDVPSTTARIRVENTLDSTVYDDSDANFKIQGNFILTAPNGGESWVVASSHNIAWTWGGTIPNVKLTYSTDSGANFSNTISASTPNGSGSGGNATYSWTVPDAISDTVRVRIEDPNDSTVNDESAADFKITGALAVTSPAGGERWVTNESHNVTWNTTGSIQNVKITYTHNDFVASTTVTASVANTGTYAWVIPDPGVENVPKATKIRVEDVTDSDVYANSAAFTIDYYLVSFDIRDLLTNAAISELSVEAYKSTDKNFIIWQEGGISTIPPRVQPMPAGVWTVVFTKTGYGDLKVNVTADRDQSFSLFMETTVIHLWLADSRLSYNPDTKMLDVTAWLSRDGSMTLGAVSMTWQIGQGSVTLGSFPLTKIYDPAAVTADNPTGDTGYYNGSINAGPTGLDLQSGVVYRTLTIAPIGSGGEFKTPSSFEITAAKKLQEVQDQVNYALDKPLSAVEAAISADMNAQLTDTKEELTDTLNSTSDTLIAKMDTTSTELKQKMDDQTVLISDAIDEFSDKAENAVFDINDATAELAVKLIASDSTKVGSTEAIRVSADPLSSVTVDMICPDGSVVNSMGLSSAGDGMFVGSEKFSAQAYRCAIDKAVTIVATVTIPSKDPDEPPFVTTAIDSINITSTTLSDVAAAAAGGMNAEKAASEAKKAIEEMGKSLQGNGNIQESLSKLQNTVDRFPAMMSESKGNAAGLKSALEEVSNKLYTFMGNEGYDFRSILKQEIGDGMKGMRNKVDRTLAATDLIHKIVEQKMGGSDQPIVQSFYEAVEV